MDRKTGLLNHCTQCPSPNKDNRPESTSIDLIVVHSISLPPGRYGGDFIERFFQNRLNYEEHPYFEKIANMQVSSHVLIKRNGDILQFVPFHERAWHAGQSVYRGRERCNDFSIGIELEGTDCDNFDDIQYQQLAQLIRCLQQAYPAIKNNITGHSDIAPGRKKDPGSGFNWEQLQQCIDRL